MGNTSIKSVLSGLACADLWKYVFNSMECHSHCCDDDGCECDCNTSEIDIEEESNEESTEDLRSRLAAEAKRTGVMQAAPGTQQGKTGWYIDSSGELTSWLVSESGEWTRMS